MLKNLFGSRNKQAPNGVYIYFYGNYESQLNYDDSDYFICVQDSSKEYTAEDFCLQVAQKLDISSLAFPMFALVTTDLKLWLAPNQKIVYEPNVRKEYIFRIRFFPTPYNEYSVIYNTCLTAFTYFFHQIRNDFINDNLDFLDIYDKETCKLSLSLIDLLIYANLSNQQNYDLINIKQFIPKKLLQKNDLIDKYKLKKQMKEHLCKSEQKFTYLHYVINLRKYLINYEAEIFNALFSNKKCLIKVNPYATDHPGIYIETESDKYNIQIQDLEDIIISNEKNLLQIIWKNGQPRFIEFSDTPTLLSFVALLDGYYRLSVDYYYHICKQVYSPYFTQNNLFKCHGPAKRDWCIKRLQDCYNHDSKFNYLIRTSVKKFNTFIIVCIPLNSYNNQPCRPRCFEISQSADGRYHLIVEEALEQPFFDSVQALIDHYKLPNSSHIIKLDKCIQPSKMSDQSIYICQMNLNNVENKIPLDYDKPYLINKLCIEDKIGEGHFTNVHLGRADDLKNCVIKQLKSGECDIVHKYFEESIHRFAFFNKENTILSVYGISLYPNLSIIMERGSQGDLETFLKRNQSIDVSLLLKAAEQIGQALVYISENNFVHGNIRCKNVMVIKYELSNLQVKMADAGLVYYYNSLPLDHSLNIERLPWIAPECYDSLNHVSSSTDIFSFAILLWEIFSNGKRPYGDLSHDIIKKKCLLGEGPGRPKIAAFYETMKDCWQPNFERLHFAKAIVKEIRCFDVDSLARHSPSNLLDFSSEAASSNTNTDSCAHLLKKGFKHQIYSANFSDSTMSVSNMSNSNNHVSNNTQLTNARSVLSDIPQNNDITNDLSSKQLLNGFTTREKLGEGCFGVVYKAETTNVDGKIITVAIKYLKRKSQITTLEFQKELSIMQDLNHPNVVSVLKNLKNANILVMEYVVQGSLKKLLETKKSYYQQNLDELIKFSLNIAEGMKYLAEKRIVHRDLAVRNILISESGIAKISDFGLSRVLEPEENYYKLKNNSSYLPAFQFAPECMSLKKFDEKTDVWSYGVTLWEIFSFGVAPILTEKHTQFYEMLQRGDRLKKPSFCPADIYKVMDSCWLWEAKDRPQFNDLVNTMQSVQYNF